MDAPDPQIEELFQAAADLLPAQRQVFLTARCKNQPELRAQVESLLFYLQEDEQTAWADSPFDPEALPSSRTSAVSADGGLANRIGAYLIQDEIGHGGMGMVYSAIKEGESHKVAIKVLRSLFQGSQPLERFYREIQLLSKLDHPFIVPILDTGNAPLILDGLSSPPLPFLVMEMVEGQSLVKHADTHQLNMRDRVILLRKVCAAVAHAHEKGIVHRDLKPANVLVDAKGEPRVLDFGIARSFLSDPDLLTLQTQPGTLLGTLPYMSPEQVAGDSDPAGAPADVYSLGVLLHQLLTGRRPLELTGLTLPEAALQIRNVDPPRPSQISPRLRGELDVILIHCLEKDAAHRYPSARELGEDLDRYLRGERPEARASGPIRIASKFARRNVGLVVGLSIAALALVLGTVFSLIFAMSASEQAEIANRRMKEASHQAYRASLGAANAYLRAGDGPAAGRALNEASPDARDWVWRHLAHRADPSLLAWRVSDRAITCAEVTPDGQRILTGDAAGWLRLWNVGNGSLIAEARAHPRRVTAIAISHDGEHVLTCNGQRKIFSLSTEVALWSLVDLTERWRLPLRGLLSADPFAPDDESFVIGMAGESRLSLRETKTGREKSTLPLIDRISITAAWSPRGDRIAYWSGDESTVVLRLDGRTILRRKMGLWNARFSSDGKQLTSTRDGLQTLDLETGMVDSSWPKRIGVVTSRLILDDEGLVLEGSRDGHLTIFDRTDVRKLATLLGNASQITSMGRLAKGTRFFSASANGWLRIWNLPTLESSRTLLSIRPGFVRNSTVNTQSTAVLQSHWAQLELLDIETGRPLAVEYRGPNGYDALAFSPDGECIAGLFEQHLQWLHGRTLVSQSSLATLEHPALCQAWSRDSQRLFVGDAAGRLLVYERLSDLPREVKELGLGKLRFIRVDPSGQRLFVVADTGKFVLLRSSDLSQIRRGRLSEGPVRCLALDGVGSRLAFGTEEGFVSIIHLDAEYAKEDEHQGIQVGGLPDALCFLERDDRLLVAVGPGLRILELPTWKEIIQVHHGQRRIHGLRFDAQRRRLLVQGDNGLSIFDSTPARKSPMATLDWMRAGARVNDLYRRHYFAEDVVRALPAEAREPPRIATKVRQWVSVRSDHPRYFNSEAIKTLRLRNVSVSRLARSIRMIQIALESFPDREDMRGTLGGLLFRQGHLEESMPHLLASEAYCRRMGFTMQPEDLAFLAMATHDLDDKVAAQRWLEALTKKMDAPDSSEYPWGRALLEEARQRLGSR